MGELPRHKGFANYATWLIFEDLTSTEDARLYVRQEIAEAEAHQREPERDVRHYVEVGLDLPLDAGLEGDLLEWLFDHVVDWRDIVDQLRLD